MSEFLGTCIGCDSDHVAGKTVNTGLAAVFGERRIAPCGEIGRHLFENMETYNHSEHAGWTAGESWTLGDSPAVGVVLDPDCGFYHETEAPIILDDTTNKFEKGRPKIRVYTSVDSRFILEDFIAKLEVLYGKGFDTK